MISEPDSHEAAKFKTSGRWAFLVVCGLFVTICVGSLVYGAVTHQLTFPLLGLLTLFLCFLVIPSSTYAVRSAELTVSDAGIFRRLFGVTCECIPWQGVENIREERVGNSRVSATVIRITGKRGKFLGVNVGHTTMTITNRYDHFEKLVDMLNDCIARNAILVHVKVNETWQRESKIRYAIEERNIYL